jgi:hypothetical protein
MGSLSPDISSHIFDDMEKVAEPGNVEEPEVEHVFKRFP